MNRNTGTSRNQSNVVILAVCLILAAGLTGCGLRGGQNNNPPAVPTPTALPQPANDPAQPTAQPAGPTAEQAQPTAAQPTAEQAQPTLPPAPTLEQPDTQGDEIEQLLDLLDKQNQDADPLDDVPQ
jgi:hypothetical protein